MYHVIKWKSGMLHTFSGTHADLEAKISPGDRVFDTWSYLSEGEAKQKYQDLIDHVCPNCSPEKGYCTGRCV